MALHAQEDCRQPDVVVEVVVEAKIQSVERSAQKELVMGVWSVGYGVL